MHHLRFTIRRGRVFVQCECGWNGSKHSRTDEALDEWRGHVAHTIDEARRRTRADYQAQLNG